jgi:hypothetical protein
MISSEKLAERVRDNKKGSGGCIIRRNMAEKREG